MTGPRIGLAQLKLVNREPRMSVMAIHLAETERQVGKAVNQADRPWALVPILYPATLVAIGPNFFGHLHNMGLSVESWAVVPFFIHSPRTCLVG